MAAIAPSSQASKARVSRKRLPVSIVVLSVLLGILVVGTFTAARAMIKVFCWSTSRIAVNQATRCAGHLQGLRTGKRASAF